MKIKSVLPFLTLCSVGLSSLAVAGGGGDGGGGGGPSHPQPQTPKSQLSPDFKLAPYQRVLGKDTKILACKGDFNVNVWTLADGELAVNVNTEIDAGTGRGDRGAAFIAKGFVNILGEAYIEISSDRDATVPDPNQTIVIANVPGLGLRGKVTAYMPFARADNVTISCELKQ